MFLTAAIFAGKLYLVQIVSGKDLSERADRQYVQPVVKGFDRGSIFFTDKDGGLTTAATLKSGFTAFINPELVNDPEALYQKLSGVIELDREDFLAKAGKKGDPYEEIAKRLPESSVSALRAFEIPGLGFYKEKWRFYPGNELAAQTIGLVGYQGDELAGRYGLERSYEQTLSRSSDDVYVNFFAEIFSNARNAFIKDRDLEGDIVTSIEPKLQTALEKELDYMRSEWRSKQAGGIVLNPKTGEIYALALSPDFDPNFFSGEQEPSVFSNSLVQSVFEMGSIIKPITMAIGLDAGKVTPKSTYDDRGFLVLNDKRIENYDGKGRGVVSMQEVLNQSLNTGAAHVALKVGNTQFASKMFQFGLGDRTGIDLPNEVKGLVSNLKTGRDIETATASYGQGIAFSPMATARALSVLANGGRLITPHVVRSIKYRIGVSRVLPVDSGRQIISSGATEDITRMLVEVFDKALAGGKYKLDRYSIAAKTGTAQIANPGGGGYYDDRYLHSFFGYFPAYQPTFLVFLFHIEPQGVEYASQTLSKPFANLAKFIINYYELPPDR